ncbi:hypothetical protein D3C86_2069920 [compost metagenome]
MLTASSLRASQPSKKSVTAATTNAQNAQRCSDSCCSPVRFSLSHGTPPAAAARATNMNSAMTRRAEVRMLGKAFMAEVLTHEAREGLWG